MKFFITFVSYFIISFNPNILSAGESENLDKIPNCQKKITFADYKVNETFKGPRAKRNRVSIKKKGLHFFLGLDDRFVGKPNFAGFYRILEGGCGTSCQRFAAFDVRNGEPYDLELMATVGIKYQIKSNLIIMNPEKEVLAFLKSSGFDSYPTIYFKWTGEQLEPICKKMISNPSKQ